jgi:hypothetical protein
MVQEHLGPVSQTSFSEILSAPTPSEFFSKVCDFSASVNFKAFLMNISWSSLIYVKSQVIRWDMYITFLKGHNAGFPKTSKLSINFCFEILDCQKNGVTAYLIPVKMPISQLRVYGF